MQHLKSLLLSLLFLTISISVHAQNLKFPTYSKPDTFGYAKSGEVNIHYYIWNIEKDGTPLILLHGGLGYSGHWGYQIEEFKKYYKIIAIDTRGHGRSRMPYNQYDTAVFTYEVMAKDVLAVMDQMAINKASILGWSDGGNVALTMAIKYPDRLKSALLYAANYNSSGLRPARNYKYFTQYLRHCEYVALARPPHDHFFVKLRRALRKMWRTQPKFTEKQLRSIKIPVAVFSGQYDEIIKTSHTEKIARLIPNSQSLTIWNSTHFSHLQKPKLFNKTVLSFLSSIEE